MATNSLVIKDGNGSSSALSTFSGSYGLIPEHAVSGTVSVTASAASPVYVTGNVSISQPVNVDLTLSDQLTVVVSSSQNNNAVWVTSSAAYPAYVNVNNTASVNINGTPTITGSVGISGTPIITGSVGISGTSTITGSVGISGTPTITGSVNIGSISSVVSVTSSLTDPVYVSSSYSTPVTTKEKLPNTLTLGFFNAGVGQGIDWASTASVNVSGTFIIAQSSSTRSGLMFTNNFQNNIYVVYDSGYYSNNGFGSLTSTASAPSFFSFILYPNGTYTADPAFVNVKHSGFIVSASNISSNTQLSIYSTE